MKRRFVLWIAILSMFFAACSGAEERTAASAETVSSADEQDGQETVSAAAETTAPSESAAKPDQEAVRRAIQDFCEMLYGTLKYDSTVTFGWDDFDSIEGYMIAKWIETQRECNKIDGEEVTEIRVKPAKLVGETLEQDGGYIQCAITATEYVWGGDSPATGFDCSGFVSYVINNCGNGWDYGRLSADGWKNATVRVDAADVKPGDLIFFENTYDTTGASHVGIVVDPVNKIMIHCGNPIQYASYDTNYWRQHLYCYGRIQ